MKIWLKLSLVMIGLSITLGAFLIGSTAFAATELVKSSTGDTVYYIDGEGVRHPFPNATTYRSWYGNDFSAVVTMDRDFFTAAPLGPNITIRPGTFLVKVPSSPQVYAIEQGGVLREIADETVAEAIYGKNWAGRVADLPEVFFKDYRIGPPLKHTYTIPDDILFQEKASGQYFYKRLGLLRPFDSTAAILVNRLRLADAVVSDRSFFAREQPIAGFDRSVFDPVAPPLQDRRDCQNRDLKAAIVFVVDGNYTQAQIEKIQTIKQAIGPQFAWATNELSSIDLSQPTAILVDNGYFVKPRFDGTSEINNEVIRSFYDTNPDIFDFLIVFTNVRVARPEANEIASFIPVTNKVEGIGRPLLDRADIYGSSGKLKGIVMMGDINKYSVDTTTTINQTLNYIMHEFLHQWSAYISFEDATGQANQSLLRPDDLSHWSYYAGFISPVGGSGWVDNGNGTFTSAISQLADSGLRQYSNLDLYLMGLIPRQLLAPVFYVVPADPEIVGNTIGGVLRPVTVASIIASNGRVACSLD